MLDPKKILDDFLGSNIPGVGTSVRDTADKATQMAKDNPLAAGAIAAILLGTGTGRDVAGGALKLGGLAAVAGLAYKAYQNYQSGKTPAEAEQPTALDGELLPPPNDSSFHPETAPQGEHEFALVLVRAMIAAARADGHVDDEERKRIADKLALSGLNSDTQAFLTNELNAPVDLDAIVAAAVTDAQKVELYTASRLAIDPKTRAERGYLDLLAGRLKLPDSLIDHIEATVANAKANTAA
ncbi:tellurite resistance TerB family protein [Phyllobacterium sp. BT25]|uniref:Tellurite resistance TerB family protein n=1 Tax=Phyllobacterium pellucidum TaxID=2740464 RepID=A0A849VQ86_9HYPH|nr:tellurite resistance TerB family protein [Phyllobacterium pellucidum]NTS32158.1 tellurite resistance TerB family protein [Phyllobacterium pellucidum]